MYTIKKYANGRFYDTVTKNYITRPQIAKLLSSRKKIEIVDTKSGKNITAQVVAQNKAKVQKAKTSKQKPKARAKKGSRDSANIFIQLFRKGGDTLSDYSKKYASMWQEMLTMSKEEIDKLINLLVKDNKISEFEAKKLKKELIKYRDNIHNWVTKNVDQRINDVLNKMNLANRDQVLELTVKIKALNNKILKLEKASSTGKSKSAGKAKSTGKVKSAGKAKKPATKKAKK